MRLPQDRILHIDTEIKDGKVNVVAEWQGELVRCKDCVYGSEDYPKDIFPEATGETYSCVHSTYSHDKDFYCKYGDTEKGEKSEILD